MRIRAESFGILQNEACIRRLRSDRSKMTVEEMYFESCTVTDPKPAVLCRQVHFLEKFGISPVVAEIFKQWIGLDVGQSGVPLFVGTL
jgi:hypothetical protein